MNGFWRNQYTEMFETTKRATRISDSIRLFTFYLDDFPSRLRRESEPIFARGGELLEKGKWQDAESCYRTVLAGDSHRAQAWGDLGTALYMQDRYDEAAMCFLHVLDTDPGDQIGLYHLAMTRIQQKRLDDATDLVEKILSDDSDGTCYRLIRDNPEFEILKKDERFRQLMAVYRTVKVGGP